MSETEPTTTHTPGPWVVEENVLQKGIVHLAVTNRANRQEWMMCSVTPMKYARDVDYANAKLIAAAPDLLRVLVDLLRKIDRMPSEYETQEALDIIEKAGGVL